MKQITNETLYDTEEARQIAEYQKFGYRGNLNEVEETLYKTDDGYFLHCWGAAKTRYSGNAPDGSLTSGEEIRPITEDEVLEWCERRKLGGDALDSVVDELEGV